MVKNPPANAGDPGDSGSILGSERSPREGNGNSLQYSCLGNAMDRGAGWATVHGIARVGQGLVTKQRVIKPFKHRVHVCSVVSDSLLPHGLEPTRLLCLWYFPGMNTEVGCHFFLQGIFLVQGSNLSLSDLLNW